MDAAARHTGIGMVAEAKIEDRGEGGDDGVVDDAVPATNASSCSPAPPPASPAAKRAASALSR
jgi:hypothetical protein